MRLKEGWVEFKRIPCKEGFIDYWMGDGINNPNKPEKSLYQVNSVATYFRLNGEGDWIHGGSFEGLMSAITMYHKCSTAEEIWNEYKRPGSAGLL